MSYDKKPHGGEKPHGKGHEEVDKGKGRVKGGGKGGKGKGKGRPATR